MRSDFTYMLRRAGGIASLVLCGIIFGSAGCTHLPRLSYAEPTPVVVSHEVEELNGLTQLWSRSDVYVLWGENKTMDASIGVDCFVGDLGKPLRYDQVVCIRNETGDVEWKGAIAVAGMLAATPHGLFVADLGRSYTGFPPSGVGKYDLQTGKLVWRKDFYDTNPTQLTFFESQVQLRTWKPGVKLWVFGTDGKVIKVLENTQAFLTTPEVTYFYQNGIQATRTETGETLWEYSDPYFKLMPMFTQDKIFCCNESNSGTAYALERETGKLLWKIQNIVYGSSLAYSPEKQKVYALNRDGNLLAIDEDSGEITIAAKFSSVPFVGDIEGIRQAYELAYDQEEHILLISLGDGHQLFAFREE